MGELDTLHGVRSYAHVQHAAILALGEPLIEMIRLPSQPDGSVLYRQGIGGDTLTAVVHAARAGARVGYLSAVGDDALGDEICAFCTAERIDTTHLLRRANDPTGLNVIDPDPVARRFSYARRGSAASLYSAADLPEDAIARAQVLHVSAVSQAVSPSMRMAVQKAAEIARANSTCVSYDLNLRLKLWSIDDARDCIHDFLPFADIVLPSDDEAALLVGTTETDALLDYFESFGATHVALKRGAAGAILSSQGKRLDISAPAVEALESTGAGDTFAGVFLAKLLESDDPIAAAHQAVKAAGRTVQHLGAIN